MFDIFLIAFIILIAVTLLYGIFTCFLDGEFMGGLLLILLLTGILGFFYIIGFCDNTYTRTQDIISLEKSNSIKGNFVLGFGYIENKITYYAYNDLGNNEYKLISIDGDITIKETDNEKPAFIDKTKCIKNYLLYHCNNKKYIIVPIGSIKRQFNP